MFENCVFSRSCIKKYGLVIVISMVSSILLVGMPVTAASTTSSVTVNADITGNEVSQLLIGGFSEDLHLSIDGGLYAEKIFNRSFEFNSLDGVGNNTPLAGWTQLYRDGGAGTITVENSSPLNAVNTHYVHINVTSIGNGVGLSNSGWYGLDSKAGTIYNYSFYARRGLNYNSTLTVGIANQSGTSYGTTTISSLSTSWVKYTGTVTVNTTDPNAKMIVLANGTGDVYLDFISLLPSATFKNRPNGARVDMATALQEIHYKFIRFPGGCIIHQPEYQYNWKDMIGPVESRKEYPSTNWNMYETKEHLSNGFGYYEWLQLCEDIGTVAVPVLPIGATCFGSALDPNSAAMNQLVQDTLDFVEFCNGSATSTWGAKRAAMGHPVPFNIQYLALGNEENDTTNMRADLTKIYNAVHAEYPSLKLINTAAFQNSLHGFNNNLGAYGSDAHYYFNRGNLDWIDFIHSHDRSYPKVMIGEYGSNTRNGELEDAIDTARDKAVFEKNGDILNMSSLTLLRKIIDFNQSQMFKTNYYHVEKMWAENLADYNVNFRQSGDSNLVVVAGKDTETGDLILKLINNSANEINTAITINGMTNITNTANVTYLKPITPGNRVAKDSNYMNGGNETGYSLDLNEVSTGATTATVSNNQLNLSCAAYSFSIIRVHGIISTRGTIYEAENFSAAATITGNRVKAADYELCGPSNDGWSRVELQGVNEFVQYNRVNVKTAGTYHIKIGVKKGTNRGTTQLSIDGANLGSPIDQYAPTLGYYEVDLGTKTLSAGNHTFKFTVTGKNSASTGYMSHIDYFLICQDNNVIINDDFNSITTDNAPMGWTLDTSEGTITVQNVPSSTDKSVLISKTGTTNGKRTSMFKTFTPVSGMVTIEAKIRREATDAFWCLPYVFSSNGTLVETIAFEAGSIKANIGGTWQVVQSFTASTWYNVKLVLSTESDTFDLYIDGIQKLNHASLRNAVTDISKMEFYSSDSNTGNTYVDNIKIYN